MFSSLCGLCTEFSSPSLGQKTMVSQGIVRHVVCVGGFDSKTVANLDGMF